MSPHNRNRANALRAISDKPIWVMRALYHEKEVIPTNGQLQNMYQSAREGAGMTQEYAAELLELSPRSIQNYESGLTSVNPETVQRMAAIYHAPGLANRYCNECPLGARRPLPAEQIDLQQLAIEIALEFGNPEEFREDALRMLEIAADRRIRDNEISDYEAISERIWRRGLLAEKARLVLASSENRGIKKHLTAQQRR